VTKAAERRWLRIAGGLLERPTATCLEHAPAAYVRSFARRRPGLGVTEDRYGNLIVKFPGRGSRKAPPLVLMAHLDHPGFVVDRVQEDLAHLTFRGGVRIGHARPGSRLAFFRVGRNTPIGKGRLLTASGRGARRRGFLGAGTARITSGWAVAGGFTMWDFPGFARRGGRIVSRCLDDLLGAAAALVTLDEVHRRRPRGAHVWGYFTRAEEIGFFGALAGIRARSIPKSARVLSLETSRAFPHAPLGGGVIVRVGDARSLFEPRLMGVLHEAAAELGEEDPRFRFQRRLMDGGVCEATPYCAAGYRGGGLALPLGNYHNMKGLDGGPKGIGPEHVRIVDFLSEVRLLVRLAERSADLVRLERATEAWLAPATRRACETLEGAPLDAPREERGRARRTRRGG
jgi:endoglucanase